MQKMMNVSETDESSLHSSDPRIEAMKEYLQIFSSHFREAVNGEVEMFMESVANYFRHITVPSDIQIPNQTGVIKSSENDAKDEEKEHLKSELKRVQGMMCVYESALKLSNTIIEMYLARDFKLKQ